MNRALRRHHTARLKHKRRHDLHFAGMPLGMHVQTPARCSCWMCGNPRRFNGNSRDAKTMQELRQATAANDSEAFFRLYGLQTA